DTKNQRVVLQTEGQSLAVDDIARTVLLSQGAASVTLGNVAEVVEAPEPPIGGAAIDGQLGVIINVSAQYGANTVAVTKAVQGALKEVGPGPQAAGVVFESHLSPPATPLTTPPNKSRTTLFSASRA